jgi:hypothetical protein
MSDNYGAIPTSSPQQQASVLTATPPSGNYGNFAVPAQPAVSTNRSDSSAAPSSNYGSFALPPSNSSPSITTNKANNAAPAAAAPNGNYGAFPIGNAPAAHGTSSPPVIVTGGAAPGGANYGSIPSSSPPPASQGAVGAPVVVTGGSMPGGANYGVIPSGSPPAAHGTNSTRAFSYFDDYYHALHFTYLPFEFLHSVRDNRWPRKPAHASCQLQLRSFPVSFFISCNLKV